LKAGFHRRIARPLHTIRIIARPFQGRPHRRLRQPRRSREVVGYARSEISMKMLIATGNLGKAREFREMLGQDRFRWIDLSQLKGIPVPEETGKTFRANACLKATYYATQSQMWALADDSGLEVDAIQGSPGVLSARWAEINSAGKGDADNNALLLRQLAKVDDPHRTARFVCVLALSDPQGRIVLTVRDVVEGSILRQARGQNGFGYDPLFLLVGSDKTTAEMPAEEKHRISHRGKALARLRQLMQQSGIGEIRS
jgi:non-canonical purine NTP pyrophosphatase (RdgB/HAM1 family)